MSDADQRRGVTANADREAWVQWLDAHAGWRRTVADLVHGRSTSWRAAPVPPDGTPPADDTLIALRVAAAAEELAQLREQASRRISGELHAALAYRTAGL